MGEVYRARDTRLDRTVAIKVLPAELARDEERRARFEREARAVSALNHPHICTLYDIGQQDGVNYLVLEYLEGETIADRLQKGALPLEQALRIEAQIADALDKAHRAGIVHRDFKPGNVMLTKSGAKLLDFGLPRVEEPVRMPGGLSTLPTQAKPLTEEGSLIGTFQYMAPEQLEGKKVDARTDIFALGSVVYEMVTGKRAFEAKSPASLIGERSALAVRAPARERYKENASSIARPPCEIPLVGDFPRGEQSSPRTGLIGSVICKGLIVQSLTMTRCQQQPGQVRCRVMALGNSR
jgi:serine/threonine protein kinase